MKSHKHKGGKSSENLGENLNDENEENKDERKSCLKNQKEEDFLEK